MTLTSTLTIRKEIDLKLSKRQEIVKIITNHEIGKRKMIEINETKS